MPEPREQLATALANFLTPEQLSKLIDEVLSVEKRMYAEFNCKKCGANQFQYGKVSDAKSVAAALTDLLTQAYGRPGEEAHQAEPIQLYRVSSLNEVPDDGSTRAAKPLRKETGRQRKTVGKTKLNPEAA